MFPTRPSGRCTISANTALIDLIAKLGSPALADDWGPALAGPTNEETLKALGVLLLALIVLDPGRIDRTGPWLRRTSNGWPPATNRLCLVRSPSWPRLRPPARKRSAAVTAASCWSVSTALQVRACSDVSVTRTIG